MNYGKESAIIITDVQVDYCHPSGKFARHESSGGFGIDIGVLDSKACAIGSFIEKWKSKTDIILLCTEEEKPGLAIRGTPGHNFHPAINTDGCKVIQKFDRNGFKSELGQKSELKEHLDNLNKTHLLHGGFLLSRCVYATLIGGHQIGYTNTLITDLTGNPPPKQNEADIIMNILSSHEEAEFIESSQISFS